MCGCGWVRAPVPPCIGTAALPAAGKGCCGGPGRAVPRPGRAAGNGACLVALCIWAPPAKTPCWEQNAASGLTALCVATAAEPAFAVSVLCVVLDLCVPARSRGCSSRRLLPAPLACQLRKWAGPAGRVSRCASGAGTMAPAREEARGVGSISCARKAASMA